MYFKLTFAFFGTLRMSNVIVLDLIQLVYNLHNSIIIIQIVSSFNT